MRNGIMITQTDRDALAGHPLHAITPPGGPYRFGLFHHDRLTTKGIYREAKSVAKLAVRPRNDPRKFLIFCRPRSGSSLLNDLLNQVEGVLCAGEMLHYAVVAPVAYLDRCARTLPGSAFGAKLLTYQMLEIQRVRDPLRLFQRFVSCGFSLIHLRRDTFDQTLSLATSFETRDFQARPKPERKPVPSFPLDRDAFLHMLRWNAATLDFEDRLMSHFPHLTIEYETGLKRSDDHQATIDRVCDYIGISSSPVSAQRKRVSGGKPLVSNVEELREAALSLRPDFAPTV
ncbi:hypothetical protein LX81_00145 [Palleronia aestuarii]|uniref:LPS sulfotransferase NodH n=1 Tax=Palleronia aestuarii TaxID=568105 RepID=A0A2W7NHF9_9RHOB|nr:hypothetical protein [Palleronia aestuarii]PZX19688.1 hypothetical protein LX81_00145 [Palleronia aestuarii]